MTNLVSEVRNIIFYPLHISFRIFISECVKNLNLLLKYAGFLSMGMGSGCRGIHAPDFSGLGMARMTTILVLSEVKRKFLSLACRDLDYGGEGARMHGGSPPVCSKNLFVNSY